METLNERAKRKLKELQKKRASKTVRVKKKQLKTEIVTFRLTPKEKMALSGIAKLLGVTNSRILRGIFIDELDLMTLNKIKEIVKQHKPTNTIYNEK